MQICRWSILRAQKVKSGTKKKGGGEKTFLKCMYSRALGEKVRKKEDLSHQRAGRQRRWQQLTGTALSQAHELSMHGQAIMLAFL